MDKVIAKRTELLTDKKAKWLEEQRHKWMCGEQPDYLEDCPFQSLGGAEHVNPNAVGTGEHRSCSLRRTSTAPPHRERQTKGSKMPFFCILKGRQAVGTPNHCLTYKSIQTTDKYI